MLLNKIENRLDNFPGNIGIYYIDLSTGQRCSAGNCDVFPAAGMVKLLLLLEVFNQISQGTLKENEKIVLKKKDTLEMQQKGDKPDFSYGIVRYLHEGIELTVKDLYQLMMIISDNAAYNILLKHVGMDSVNQTLYELGLKQSKVNRRLYSGTNPKGEEENLISVSELSMLFERLYNGLVISETASKKILDVMKYHQRTNIIPYYFIEEVPIAHQTGFDIDLNIDAGIIYAEKPFILCMGASRCDSRDAEYVMRDITTLCFEHSMNL